MTLLNIVNNHNKRIRTTKCWSGGDITGDEPSTYCTCYDDLKYWTSWIPFWKGELLREHDVTLKKQGWTVSMMTVERELSKFTGCLKTMKNKNMAHSCRWSESWNKYQVLASTMVYNKMLLYLIRIYFNSSITGHLLHQSLRVIRSQLNV